MLVPTERPVWLKFGVHPAEEHRHASRTSDDERDLLTQSPFEPSGPFELRLTPGDQTLSIAVGSARDGSLPIVIHLNERALLKASFVSADVNGAGWGHTSATSQVDFGSEQQLPWLMTASMNLRSSPSGMTHAFSIWLSDRSSNFKRFPAESHSGRVLTK
jgi:hypothetical protein